MPRLLFVALLAAAVLAGFAPAPALGQSIPLTLPDAFVTEGDPVSIAIATPADLTGEGVLAYQIALQFNDALLTVDRVETTGTLSDAFGSVEFSIENPGRTNAVLRLAAAGTAPLTGSGDLVTVVFATSSDGRSGLSFDADRTFFNEGAPTLDLTDTGTIDVAALPVVSVSPNQATVLRGETQTFSASGGAEPYTWTVTNAAIASIDDTGLLMGLAPGTTRVVAADANGVRDTTDVVTVAGYRLRTSDASTFPGRTVAVPVVTTDLGGLDVTAGTFRLSGFSTRVLLEAVGTAGTLLDGATVTFGVDRSNVATIAFASDAPLAAGPDTLLTLQVRLTDDAAGTVRFQFDEIVFNETLPGIGGSGTLRVDALPTLRLTPGSGTLIVGEAVDLSVSNAADPVTWTVSDPARAAISPAGRLTALRGGSVTVTATDARGAAVTSSPFSIADVTLALPDTSVRPNTTFRLPVRIGNLPAATGPTAVEMRIRYPGSLVAVTGVDANGTQTDGWTYTLSDDGSLLTLAGAGTRPVNADGDLLTLTLQSVDQAGSSSAQFRIEAVTLNEGDPVARVVRAGRVTVTDANRGPAFTAFPALVSQTGTAYAASVEAKDPDGDALTLDAPMRPAWLTFTDNGDGTGSLSGTPPADGFYPITLRVSDGALSTQTSLRIGAYSFAETLTFAAGDPAPQSTSDGRFILDFTSLDASTDVSVAVQTNPEETTLALPSGDGLAVQGVWSLETGTAATFRADVCFSVETRVNDVDVSAISVRTRESATDPWSAPLAVETKTASDGTPLLCAVDVRTFSAFVLTAPEEDLPVELTYFRAEQDEDAVSLAWTTASESSNAGFHVERAVDGAAFRRLGFVRGAGTTDAPQAYRFTDRDLPMGAVEAVYRLRQVDLDGTEHLSAPVTVRLTAPAALALSGPAPHPVRGRATVRYALPTAGDVRIDAYNLLGQRVATLVNGPVSAGPHELALHTVGWASGVYFLRLTSAGQVRTQRVTVVR